MKILLPHPAMSAIIAAAWLLLTHVSFGQFLLAIALAIAIPLYTQRFMPGPSRLRGWHAVTHTAWLVVIVIWDVIRANVWVARLVLGRLQHLQPAFVEVPLEVEQPLARALLASIITMTPGTVSASFSPDHRRLLVHVLHTDDPAAVVARIKARYERPLTRIFQ